MDILSNELNLNISVKYLFEHNLNNLSVSNKKQGCICLDGDAICIAVCFALVVVNDICLNVPVHITDKFAYDFGF